MTTINCVAGDTGDERTVALSGVDLTTAISAEAHVWPTNNTGTAVDCPVTLDTEAGTGTVELGTFLGALTGRGVYNLCLLYTSDAADE